MSSVLERWLARQLLALVGNPPINLQLSDGSVVAAPSASACHRATIRLHDRRALPQLLYKPTRTFGDLYADNRLTVNTDVRDVLADLYGGLQLLEKSSGRLRKLVGRLFERGPRANSRRGAKRNVSAHYDLGNDFYRLWLDTRFMQYTCAYFPSQNVTLEQAQAAKLELICRKLALRPGETLVEAGGGWGGLARYCADRYGVKVRSYNVSREQVAYATAQARKAGLDDLVEYVEDDYRNISGTYDAFVSVGMLEHVGVSNYGRLGVTIDRCLKDDGRGLIHTIGQNYPRRLNEWIEANIFPGAYPPTLGQMMEIFEPSGFSVVDVENLRAHYAQTLRAWRDRFGENVDKVTDMFGERFVRVWHLYLSGSLAAFDTGTLQLFQVLFARPHSRCLPDTRAHLYLDG